MKKLLLGLGTLATVAAPVAAVVACGSTQGGNISGHKETGSEKALRELMEGSSSAMESWTTTGNEVADYITSTKSEGILDLDISSGQKVSNFKNAAPVYSKDFSKLDIIAKSKGEKDETIFDDIAKEIKAALKGEDAYKFGMIVTTVKKDDAKNEGEYKVSVYRKKDSLISPLDQAALDLHDKTKYVLDKDMIAKYHGAYTFGLHHNFSGGDVTSTKLTMKTKLAWGEGFMTGTSGASFFNDRISEDNFYTWSLIKPLNGANMDGSTIEDEIYVINKKTGIYNLRLELSKGGATRTIYIENPLITSYDLPSDTAKLDRDWMVNKFDDAAFKKIWNEKYNFTSVYTMFNSMKAQAGNLDQMEPLKGLIIDISSTINTLASTYNEIKDPTLYGEFVDFLKNKYKAGNPAGDMDHLMMGIQDFKMYDDKDMYTKYMAAIGTKGYDGLIWSRNLLQSYSEFIDSKVKATDHPLVLSKITTAKGLSDALKAEKALADKATVIKKYLTDNKITFDASLSNAEIVKFITDKAKSEITKAKAIVPAAMTAITASDDGHLKDTYDALVAEITKQDAIDTTALSEIDTDKYANNLLVLHNEVAKVNAAIVSLNADATFDTAAIIKEVQSLGVKIPGLISINIPDAILNTFVAKAKAASDTNGHNGFLGATPSDKEKLLIDLIVKNKATLFTDKTFENYYNSKSGYISQIAKGDVQKFIDSLKAITSTTDKQGKISQNTFDVISAIVILIA